LSPGKCDVTTNSSVGSQGQFESTRTVILWSAWTKTGDYLLALTTWKGKAPDDALDILGRARTLVCMFFGRTGMNDGSKTQLAATRAIPGK